MADLPDLHELASEHFTYADFATAARLGAKQALKTLHRHWNGSYWAISEHCENILEPVEAEDQPKLPATLFRNLLAL